MSILNERIKKRRISLNLTLSEIADFLGVKEATAQRYESGEIKNIKHETIVALSNILKCSPAYLMGWEENTSSDTNFSLSELEKQIILSYRKSDDIGKAIVLRSLGLEDALKGEVEKMA